MNETLKTRFCPSPTGNMHLGNVRTALFNALLAKGRQGCFLLRIEDTDKERSQSVYCDALLEDLKWLGLDWNEGPQQEGGAGPYYQSQRQKIYDDYYHKLESTGIAYPCFCSEEELALMRKIQRSTGKPPRYAGTCRSLKPNEIQAKIDSGLKPTLRFRIPDHEVIEFEDMVHGLQRFQTDDMGDFIIRRADGTPPFLYCNALDDALMGVTHVLRGEDHLANTPRQVMLLKVLGLRVPKYGHIPLILGHDGSPLAKRHGSRSIVELRREGYLPLAIINYLARLGHYYGHDDFMTLRQLADNFKIESLNKSPAKFNLEQLNYWQKEAVARLDDKETWNWLGNEIQSVVPEAQRHEFIETVKPNLMFPNEGKYWAKVFFNNDLIFEEEEARILKSAGPDYFKVALSALEQFGPDLPAIIKHLKQVLNVRGEALYSPLRVAVTGQKHGPELSKIFHIMDLTVIRHRLEVAI